MSTVTKKKTVTVTKDQQNEKDELWLKALSAVLFVGTFLLSVTAHSNKRR